MVHSAHALEQSRAAERFRLAIENSGVSAVELARRIGHTDSTAHHWSERGVPCRHLAQVAPALAVSARWLARGRNAPLWYLRRAALEVNLPISTVQLSNARLVQAWYDVIHGRLLERLITGIAPVALPAGASIPRATFFRTQGLAYMEALEFNDLVTLGERLGVNRRGEVMERYLDGYQQILEDAGEVRRRHDRRLAMDADRMIALGAAEVSTADVRRQLDAWLDECAVAYEQGARKPREDRPTDDVVRAMSKQQGMALEALDTPVAGEGTLSGEDLMEAMFPYYRFARRLDLIGADHVSLDHAILIALAGAFSNRSFRFSEMSEYLMTHFGLDVSRANRNRDPSSAKSISATAVRAALRRAGVLQFRKQWTRVPGTGSVPGLSR